MLTIEIRIEGIINSKWSEWFNELEISYSEDGESVLHGKVQDQSALYGLIGKLRDLGLTLISMTTSEWENDLEKHK